MARLSGELFWLDGWVFFASVAGNPGRATMAETISPFKSFLCLVCGSYAGTSYSQPGYSSYISPGDHALRSIFSDKGLGDQFSFSDITQYGQSHACRSLFSNSRFNSFLQP